MRDRPLLRLSRLLSMDSHPSLPRPSVCGSLEPTTLLMKPVAWFSTCVFPSRGVICAFSQQCSPYSDVFCPTRSMALLTFPLFLPLLPLACYQGERTCLSFSARLLSSRCASRGSGNVSLRGVSSISMDQPASISLLLDERLIPNGSQSPDF